MGVTGTQACMNLFYPYNRGALYTALIVLYSLTAGIAGYVAASYYKQASTLSPGRAWIAGRCCVAGGFLTIWDSPRPRAVPHCASFVGTF